ncbi:MAG: class I SAM-dependent methyltransferase [Kiritimatiellae bacterium]|jgi:SAM-dependent methyltransferase|nr:class I SAM-dependent methyltransferase [Kiritimatiellia bacterium]
MKNILDDRAVEYELLHGRCKFCCDFVDIESISGKSVLDIGCGFGWFDLFALRHSPSRVVGIEPQALDLDAARQSVNDPRIVYQEGSALNLPFDSDSFDTVVCWDVIEHLPKMSESTFFKEVYRVLRPSGELYISTPYRSFLSTVFDPAWWLIGHRHYTTARLVALAEDAGLTVPYSTIRGSIFEIAGLWNMYICKWVFRRQPMFHSFFEKKEDAEHQREGFMTLFLKAIKPNKALNTTLDSEPEG